MKVTRIVALALSAILLLAVSALADPMLKVTFPEKGSYLYWMEAEGADGKPVVTAPKHAAGASADIDLAPAAPAGKLGAGELRIYDPKSGNLAVKPLANLMGKKELVLKPADFDRVARVRIQLKPAEAKTGELLESAVVTLTDANSDVFTTVVDPSSEGTAEFRNVAAGMESVTVAYDGGKMTQEMEIPQDRKDPVFRKTILISADVRTIKPEAAAAAPGAKPGTPAPKESSGRTGILSTIAGIIFLALVVFIGYVVMKSKGVTLEGSLRKAGVQFPQDAAADTAGAPAQTPAQQVDPNVCPFCGQRKDANGKCACSLEPGMATATATATGVARLVGLQGPYAGRVFEFTGSEMTIGREATNTIALTDDGTSSRRHAKFDKDSSGFAVTDLGSSNGTFVNGAKITGEQHLSPGDEVQIGSTKFKFEV